MENKLKVGVIFGGRSGEHEVSLVSATSVINNLDTGKYDIIPIGISRGGSWFSGKDVLKQFKENVSDRELEKDRYFFSTDPGFRGLIAVDQQKNINIPLDIVFPILHGTYGEDGKIQGLFEMADIPYVGADLIGSAIGMDKVISKQLFAYDGLPVTKFVYFDRKKWEDDKNYFLDQIEIKLKYPVFVKPANLGSSIGISKAGDRQALLQAIHEASKYDRKIIIEEGVLNAREIEFSILGNEDPIVSLPGEIIPSNDFYDYNAKYVSDKSQLIIPAQISNELLVKMQEDAISAFKIIGCTGMGRIDFLLEKNSDKYYINEINTIPGFTSISMYPKLWEISGISYSELLEKLISFGLDRFNENKKNKVNFETPSWYK